MAIRIYLAGGTIIKLPSGEILSEEEWEKRNATPEKEEIAKPVEEETVPQKKSKRSKTIE